MSRPGQSINGRQGPGEEVEADRVATSSSSRSGTIASLVVGLATLAVMLATEPGLAIVWDEGYTLGREARVRLWFQALRDPAAFAARWQPPVEELVQQVGAPPPLPEQLDTRSKLFDSRVLAWFWPFAREEPHGHPPFYALVGLIGDLVAPRWAQLPRARLGPILLFSLTAGVLFQFVTARWGLSAGIAAAGAWVFQPNLFGHGHYATYDGILSALWVLSIACFARAVSTRGDHGPGKIRIRPLATIAFGAVCGCALATKFTGWFLPIPFLIWAVVRRDRTAIRCLLGGLPLAVLVLFALNPAWWTEPITGVVRFLRSNLTRGQTMPIKVLFLGKIYQTPNESLPWYNTIVWTVMVTPLGFLILGLTGIFTSLKERKVDPIGLLILGHWLMLMTLRALPHTPGHDGVRLFLPAFGLLALLAGMGAKFWCRSAGRLGKIFVGGAVMEGIVSVSLMMPVPLSYFSPLVGGLPGASRLGMEPTYYWDALDGESRAWLRANTGPGQLIQFATFPRSWLYLRSTGELPRRLLGVDTGRPTWFVLQNRPGAWEPTHRAFAERMSPAFTVRKLGVPLVWIFPL